MAGAGGEGPADAPGRWLAVSLAALGVLAGGAAVVSFAAQYQMVRAARRLAVVSALEAGIPDAAALVFATLGIALALGGRRAVRARVLNLAAVGTSLGMNALAAGHGWRDLAIWVMPPAAYALASDTAIGVIRLRSIARQQPAGSHPATPLASLGSGVLWLARLTFAPVTTVREVRALVTGPRLPATAHQVVPSAGQPEISRGGKAARPGTKTASFLRLVTEHYGPLTEFPLADVSPVASELAPAADLHPGAARAALRRHVLAARLARTGIRSM
jgi:hypothetical protein